MLNVEDEANRVSVSTDPSSNGGALVLGQKELQALVRRSRRARLSSCRRWPGLERGPKAGRSILTDSRAATCLRNRPFVRSRINSNPFSPEYDRPGFGRIEIFTKPGTNAFHGQAFFQYNDQYFNTRSPLYAQSSSLPPYKNLFFGGNVSGPIKKDKASFTLDFERRDITENAFILATDLNASLLPQTVNQALLTPQTRTTIESARGLRNQREQYPCGALSRCSHRPR